MVNQHERRVFICSDAQGTQWPGWLSLHMESGLGNKRLNPSGNSGQLVAEPGNSRHSTHLILPTVGHHRQLSTKWTYFNDGHQSRTISVNLGQLVANTRNDK